MGFKRLDASDIIIAPYAANKQWSFLYNGYPSEESTIKIFKGTKITGSTFDSDNDPVTEGEYERLVYDSVNQLFYQAYTESISGSVPQFYSGSLSHNQTSPYYYQYNGNPNFVRCFPTQSGDGIRVLSIPKSIYGSQIKPGQFVLSSSFYNIVDDGNGNLYNQYTGSRSATATYSVLSSSANPGSPFIINLPGFNLTGSLNSVEIIEYINSDRFGFSLNNTSASALYKISYSRQDFIQSTAFTEVPTNTYVTGFGPFLVTGSSTYVQSVQEFLYNYKSIDLIISGSEINNFIGSSPIVINGFPSIAENVSSSNGYNLSVTSSYDFTLSISYNYSYSASVEFVGNIFYEHGLVVITNQNYQSLFPLPPLATDDEGTFSISTNPKNINVIRNDIARTGILDSASISLFGGNSQYFTSNGDGTVSVNTPQPGFYHAFYTINADYNGTSILTSNIGKITAVITN